MALVGLLGQAGPPPGSGWQGWLFIGLVIGVPVLVAQMLSRHK